MTSTAKLEKMWTDNGGIFHGPFVEQGSMEKTRLLWLLESLSKREGARFSGLGHQDYATLKALRDLAKARGNPLFVFADGQHAVVRKIRYNRRYGTVEFQVEKGQWLQLTAAPWEFRVR